LDLWVDRAPEQTVSVVSRPERYDYPANWKFQAENGVDGYHGNFVHESYAQIIERSGGATVEEIRATRNQVGDDNYAKGFDYGDGLLERTGTMLGAFDVSTQQAYQDKLVELHGEERSRRIGMMRNIFVFTNPPLRTPHI